jgi:hypothetical protein
VNPSAPKVGCPFCVKPRRVKGDGTFYEHDYGRPGMMRRCPASNLTPDAAKAAKSAGPPYEVPSGRPDSVGEVNPEDIF